MAAKEAPMVWRTCDEEKVTLSEDGAVATNVYDDDGPETLVTSGDELTAGKHYWEVEILSDQSSSIEVGVTRPNLDLDGDYAVRVSTDGWFIDTYESCLFGNGKHGDDPAGPIDEGDRVGVLLDLNEGSLRFFKNGVQHGPGYPADSVTGPGTRQCSCSHLTQALGCFHKMPTMHCCSRGNTAPGSAVSNPRWPSSAAQQHSSQLLASHERPRWPRTKGTGDWLGVAQVHAGFQHRDPAQQAAETTYVPRGRCGAAMKPEKGLKVNESEVDVC
jgi:hypothetical protein